MTTPSLPARAGALEGGYTPLLAGALVNEVPLDAGHIRFWDSYRPALTAGDYTVAIRQKIESSADHRALRAPAAVDQKFAVVAPRFALEPSAVQATFPPPNASGPFGQNLPHVVLTSRALPWERSLGTGLGAPWLALLLFTPDQLVAPPGDTVETNPVLAGTYTVEQLLHPGGTTMGPPLSVSAGDGSSCRAIDVKTEVFTQVAPRLADLPYLAHARQVSVDDKTTSLAGTNGWFAVVVGNRFPLAGAGDDGTRYIAHLVSLEGYAPWLVDAPAWPAGTKAVRLASLASWAFTVQARGLDFRRTMLQLVANQPPGGDGLRLRLPVADAEKPPVAGSPEAQARTALAQGYAALEYETRVAARTFGWYHGPLVPQPVGRLARRNAFDSSAAATVYDVESGTFDLSYAACWEVGRLLALSDSAYAASQQRARKSLRMLVNLVRERTRWRDGQRMLAAAEPGGAALKDITAPARVSRGFGAWLADAGASVLGAHAGVAAPPVLQAASHEAPRRPAAHLGVRSLLGRGDVRALVAQHVEARLGEGEPLDDVAGWLGRLRILEGVPFVHLVPDARMLPVESIRFFYVDRNALDAMCDGAESVGVQTTRDALQHDLVRGALRQAAIARGSRRRAGLLRSATRRAPNDAAPADPVAGFLLRSAVVSGWPGLEVRAWRDAKGTIAVPAVRIDHLAADVLLALFPEVPARVDLDEPKEGLAFGVQADWLVGLRDVTGDVGKQRGSCTLTADYRRDNGVLKVDLWQKHLGEQIPGSATVWGPAAFAIQMIRAANRMVFDNAGGA